MSDGVSELAGEQEGEKARRQESEKGGKRAKMGRGVERDRTAERERGH